MNKHDLIQKVKALDGISQDERAYLIDLINTKKKYGLVWEDKPEEVEETLRQHLPVLQEVVEKRILSEPGFIRLKDEQDSEKIKPSQPSLFDETGEETNLINQNNPDNHSSDKKAVNHTLIEGDNLHALTALTFTHENKIDVIYIDPPYNTGNKDFKYNDSFVDKEDSYRHSKWLSFMDKRLRIAKRLLSDKGVIFISIDDYEQATLKLLCDEIFTEMNFVGNVIWQRAYAPINLKKTISQNHDFVLIYCKQDFQSFELNKLPRSEEGTALYKNPDNDKRGPWQSDNFSVGPAVKEKLYEIITPSGRSVYPPNGRCWLLTKERYEEFLRDGRIWFGSDGKGVPRIKRFLSEVKDGVVAMSLWTYQEVGHTQEGKRELKEILHENQNPFETVKPLRLIDRILKLGSQKDSTILDFFAGSGTTLHATIALNAEDGGSRQCILVTNNENNICEEVTYERNKRVIEGYTNAKGVRVEGLSGNHLRYYRTATVEREPSLRNKRQLTRLATELLCIKEDCYTPRATTDTALQAYEEKAKRLLLVYDDAMIDEALEYLKTWLSETTIESPIKVYVFSNGQYPYTEDFEEVLPHITLCALPDAIYKAYQHVLPKRVAPVRVELEEENSLEQD